MITFHRLLGGLSTDRFFDEYRDRKHFFIRNALSNDEVASLLSLDRLDEILSSRGLAPPAIEIISNGTAKSTEQLSLSLGGVNLADLLDRFSCGASIRIRSIQLMESSLASLTRQLTKELAAKVWINAYFTPGCYQGFNPHYDDHDVLIVQCYGNKRWSIYSDYDEQIELPPTGQTFDAEIHKPGSVAAQYELNVGDALYIPRGVMHAAQAIEHGSIHLTIGLGWKTWAELAVKVLGEAILRDVRLRQTIPQLVDSDASTQIKNNLSTLISAAMDQVDIERTIEDLTRARFETQHPPVTGSFAAFANGPIVKGDRALRMQEGVLCRLDLRGDTGTLIVHDQEVSLTTSQIPIVESLLQGNTIRLSSLDDSTFDQLVRRLLVSGFVALEKLAGNDVPRTLYGSPEAPNLGATV